MSDEADVSLQGTDTQPADFNIPDEYKDKGWVNNIKSTADLWKAHENAQSLIGRKTIGIPTDTSTEEEVESFYSKIRPAESSLYEADLGEDTEYFKELFHKNGLSKKQADNIVKGYMENINKANETYFSAEGYKDAVKSVGIAPDRHDEIVAYIKKTSPEGCKSLDGLPNNALAAVYDIVNRTMTAYGAKESGGERFISVPTNTPKEPDYKGFHEARAKMTGIFRQEDIDKLRIKFGV